jgi:hypothetical protein
MTCSLRAGPILLSLKSSCSIHMAEVERTEAEGIDAISLLQNIK